MTNSNLNPNRIHFLEPISQQSTERLSDMYYEDEMEDEDGLTLTAYHCKQWYQTKPVEKTPTNATFYRRVLKRTYMLRKTNNSDSELPTTSTIRNSP